MSPYAYCGGDPINYIDPTGMSKYYVNSEGKIRLALWTDDNYDELYVLDANGNYSKNNSTKVEDRSVLPVLSTLGYAISDCNLLSLFYFLADNTQVEWAMSWMNDGSYYLQTDYLTDEVSTISIFDYKARIHSHPGDSQGASYSAGPYKATRNGEEILVYSGGDMETIREKTTQFKNRFGDSVPFPIHYVYHVKSGNVYKYTSDDPAIFWTNVKRKRK